MNRSQNPFKQLRSSSLRMSQIVLQFDQNVVSSKKNFALYCEESLVKCVNSIGSRGPIRLSWSLLAPTPPKRNAWELLGCRILQLAPFPFALSPVLFPALGHRTTVRGIVVFTVLGLGTVPKEKHLCNGRCGFKYSSYELKMSFAATKRCFVMLVLNPTSSENAGKVKEARA